MNKPKGILVTVLAGGCAVLAVYVAVSWGELATQYHLRHLRSMPDYIDQIAASPEGTPTHNAVVQYVQTTPGRRVLEKAILLRSPVHDLIRENPLHSYARTVSVEFLERGFVFQRIFKGIIIFEERSRDPFHPWQPFLEYIQPGELRLPEMPGLVFKIWFHKEKMN